MGHLLSLLTGEDCRTVENEIFFDFENAQPTDSELGVWSKVRTVLVEADSIIHDLRGYKGATEEIRQAISNGCDENQTRAWSAIRPLVVSLCRFYNFSLLIEEHVPLILTELCSDRMTPTEHLETQQALVKQFAELLEFVLNFDEIKMNTPAIQNDLSYYRRLLNSGRVPAGEQVSSQVKGQNGDQSQQSGASGTELANRMSLFFAEATPMLSALTTVISKFVSQNKGEPVVFTETLSTMGRVCQTMLNNPELIAKFERIETPLFVTRVMVAIFVLYDRVNPHGAFAKGSQLDVKVCVRLLKGLPSSSSESLLNAIRYTTKHLHDEETPRSVKTMLREQKSMSL